MIWDQKGKKYPVFESLVLFCLLVFLARSRFVDYYLIRFGVTRFPYLCSWLLIVIIIDHSQAVVAERRHTSKCLEVLCEKPQVLKAVSSHKNRPLKV
ncbi:hypothetical protein CEXT_507811 [Caerostris extrusa]|uniref:Uncharacterized protein n=1 Tax=Caerostris extrusa TaxID=172846 RepID=A0AAV4XB96_CAEEX|nr:hypothetical protein CEXT_507811 [Caerostris extrusa]